MSKMKEIKIDYAGAEPGPDTAYHKVDDTFLQRFGVPLQMGKVDGMDYVVSLLRFGSFNLDGNISITFPDTPHGAVAISYGLAPQIGMAPEYPDHLNYVVLITTQQEVGHDALRWFIGTGLQIIGLGNVLPNSAPAEGEEVSIPILFRGATMQTEDEKARSIWPTGAIICVPTRPEILQRNRMLATMQAFAARVTAEALGDKPAPAGAKVH